VALAKALRRGAVAAAALLVTLALLSPLALSVYRLADPWARPDFPAATEFVLAQCQPGDFIAGNSWESKYYFRRQSKALVPLGSAAQPSADRVWVVITGKVPDDVKTQFAERITPAQPD